MIDCHTGGGVMACAKIAITMDQALLKQIDQLVDAKVYASRSAAIQDAVRERIDRAGRTRLAAECARLDPVAERNLAEEGIVVEASQWPEY